MSQDAKPPVIDEVEHFEEISESNWLVSYADMMTLLVGFFVILLSFSKIDQEQYESVKRFASLEFGGTYSTPFGNLADRLRRELEKMGLGEQTIIKQNDDGVTISLRGTVFFDLGSVVIKPAARNLLEQIIPIIKSEADQLAVVIEGHTDDVPVGPTFPYKSNWELSSIRSCKVLDIFEGYKFDPKLLTAIGYGESRPVVPNQDAAGRPIAVNRDQNRRVVIQLKKVSQALVGSGEPAQPSKTE